MGKVGACDALRLLVQTQQAYLAGSRYQARPAKPYRISQSPMFVIYKGARDGCECIHMPGITINISRGIPDSITWWMVPKPPGDWDC